MMMRWVLAALIAVGLAVSTVELSCIAAERLSAEQALEAASITSAAPEMDLPGVPEGDADATPALTYTR
ncbi:MAG TPA: hypothetical protein VGU22_16500 [Methylomirabilota bacterium]|jgi:hypothetical protein|nr:hypothetical protein [Methylomirabilota bacterium]